MKDLMVSIYFMPEWWDSHYHVKNERPKKASQSALERMYHGRQIFLDEKFSDFGLGQAKPEVQGSQLATVIRSGFDLVPSILGTALCYVDAWGFYPKIRSIDQIADLKPVDISQHSEGAHILSIKERLEKRYGRCNHCIDIGSVSNNAFRIIGDEFYLGLLMCPEKIKRLFDVIIETERMLYKFLCENFVVIDQVPLSNCNVAAMGPETYTSMVLEYDRRQGGFGFECFGLKPSSAVHHCDYSVDKFFDAYSKIVGIDSIQASIFSDIASAKKKTAGIKFSGLISPTAMFNDISNLKAQIDHGIQAGVDDLAIWNVDPAIDTGQLHEFLHSISTTCERHGIRPVFSAMPLCWEELEWAHSRYYEPGFPK